MNKEEKKAIEELEHYSNLTAYWKPKEYRDSEINNCIKIVLNLIQKQQQEIEDLKENYDELFTKYEMKKVLFVRKDHNTKELLSELYIKKDTLDTDYISKDKIREKIKKEEKYQGTTKKLFTDSLNYHMQEYAIKVLQELLEE